MITTISRIAICSLLACVALGVTVRPAHAQRPASPFGTADGPKHTFNFTIGGLGLTSLEDRDSDDVLVVNFTDPDLLEFDPDELTERRATVGFEWLIPLGNFVEAGAGYAWSQGRDVASRYREYVELGTGADIEQTLALSLSHTLSFTVRAVPTGQRSPVQPYVGGGLGLFHYKYVEDGDFLDFAFDPPAIFTPAEPFEAKGWQPGLILLGGVRWAGDAATVGGEIRYHRANVDLDTDSFVAPKLSLNGMVFQFTVGARF
jgi:hypothetical protein